MKNGVVREKALSLGWDVGIFHDGFSEEQKLVIFKGCLAGIDVTQFSKPEMSYFDMFMECNRLMKEAEKELTDEQLEMVDKLKSEVYS